MKPWIRTALAGGFFLPNLVAARLDRAEQDTAFSLSTGDEQGPATVLRRKLTDGMQNLFYGAEDPVELDESAAAHTLAEMTQYAQERLRLQKMKNLAILSWILICIVAMYRVTAMRWEEF